MKPTVAFVALCSLVACSSVDPALQHPDMPAKPPIPDAIKVAPDLAVVAAYAGEGVQIYTCKDGKWTLKAPEADLKDLKGKVMGKHYAGPTWESVDGSKVVGQMKAKADGANGAIPLLLIDVKSTEGSGVFSKVTAIQRLATEGGAAPADACTDADGEKRVPYKATYYFYQPK